jgi:ferredoxin
MPAKYHIPTKKASPRVRPVGKLGIVDWREDCASCHNCVKKACVYGLYRDEADRLHNENGYLDYIYQCKGCLNCVQNCTKNILTRVVNPEYERLGDHYFTPDIILSTWYQAETGAIPVSGAGYGGPFKGPGFDSMWTDMSEIVRPTRDGIHGREYINTSVDIGRKLGHLTFEAGALVGSPPTLIESPVPILFDVLPEHYDRGLVFESVLKAAAQIGVLATVTGDRAKNASYTARGNAVPLLSGADALGCRTVAGASLVMVEDCGTIASIQASMKRNNPDQIVAVRIPAAPGLAKRALELASGGTDVIVLAFDAHGREVNCPAPRHMRDVIREVHQTLTRAGIRDQVTLISSGGIAMAEHVTKAIICGVDLVAIDLPLMIALECRLCGECQRHQACAIALEKIETDYAVQRIVNLMAAWRNQLIEMLGAMGIREARRLRGEVGRCMFFEDLERNTFGRLFGKRKVQESI